MFIFKNFLKHFMEKGQDFCDIFKSIINRMNNVQVLEKCFRVGKEKGGTCLTLLQSGELLYYCYSKQIFILLYCTLNV